jgi:hypothetical protein
MKTNTIDWSKPLQTEYGDAAEHLGRHHSGLNIVGVSAATCGFYRNDGTPINVSLPRIENKPGEKEVFINLYEDGFLGVPHKSLAEADKNTISCFDRGSRRVLHIRKNPEGDFWIEDTKAPDRGTPFNLDQ